VDYKSYYNELQKDFNADDLKKLVKDVEMPEAVRDLCKKATGQEYSVFMARVLLERIPVSIFLRILLDKLYKVGSSIMHDMPLDEVLALKQATTPKRTCNCNKKIQNV